MNGQFELMPPEVILSLRDRYGSHLSEMAVNALRYTIGSSEDDDLPLPDAPLASHQAVLKIIGDKVWLEDDRESGLITINGQPLGGGRELMDQDLIGLAGRYELIVQLSQPNQSSNVGFQFADKARVPAREVVATSISQPKIKSRLPWQAVFFAVSLLTAALVLVAIFTPERKQTNGATPKPVETIRAFTPTLSGEQPNSRLLAAVREVLKCSSDDAPKGGNYFFPDPSFQRAVEERTQYYRAEPERAARALRVVASDRQKIVDLALKTDLTTHSSLLVYVVLAEVTANPAGNPSEIARRVRPGLSERLNRFGGENPDDVLLAVATQRTDNWLGLWNRLKQLDSRNERDAWHLREKKWLGEEAYRFLLDFLALSVIAQDPGLWDVHAPALAGC